MSETTFTHSAWFCGLVPIYMADIESGEPWIIERHILLRPALIIVEALFAAMYLIPSLLITPDIDPGYPFAMVRRLETPVSIKKG